MMQREKMGETCGKVADLFAKSREGLTVREAAWALKSPENTIDFHVRMLLAAGNIVKVGKASIEDLGRPGYVYADRKHVSTSKAWIEKNEKERAARAEKAKPAKAKKPSKPKAKPAKAKPAKAKKPSKPKAKPAKAKKPSKPKAASPSPAPAPSEAPAST